MRKRFPLLVNPEVSNFHKKSNIADITCKSPSINEYTQFDQNYHDWKSWGKSYMKRIVEIMINVMHKQLHNILEWLSVLATGLDSVQQWTERPWWHSGGSPEGQCYDSPSLWNLHGQEYGIKTTLAMGYTGNTSQRYVVQKILQYQGIRSIWDMVT